MKGHVIHPLFIKGHGFPLYPSVKKAIKNHPLVHLQAYVYVSATNISNKVNIH